MGTKTGAIVVILIDAVVLIGAFKLGVIGGGAGASREESPINFWTGVSIAALTGVIAIVVLVAAIV